MRRRRLASALVAVLTLTGVAACGDDAEDGGSASSGASAGATEGSIEGLTVGGAFGEEPEVEVDGLDVDKSETTLAIEGDGEEVPEEGAVMIHSLFAVAATGKSLSNSYEQGDGGPQRVEIAQTNETLKDAIVGSHVGDRVVVVQPATDFFGGPPAEGSGVTEKDDLLIVLDIVSLPEPPLDGPEGEEVDPPADAPKADTDDEDNVVGIDFADAPKSPPARLDVITLIEGQGPKVKENDPVTVDYFGAVWGAEEAFDESYSSGTPASFTLAQGSLIDGWVEGLQGVPVGSRVMLVIPPKLGYGDQEQQNIPAGSTLVFVVDILQAGS